MFSNRINPISPKKKIFGSDLNKIIDKVNQLLNRRVRVRGKGTSSSTDDKGNIHIRVKTTGALQKLYRAKAQEGAQADGLLSVKIIDKDGNDVSATAFDTYVFRDKSATDFTSGYHPLIALNDIIFIEQIDGEWFMLNPILTEVTSMTVVTSVTVDGTNHVLKKATRPTVLVLGAGEDTGLVTHRTGTACG